MRVNARNRAVVAAAVLVALAAWAVPVPPSPQAKKKPSDQQQQQGQPSDQQQQQQQQPPAAPQPGAQQQQQPPGGRLLKRTVSASSSRQGKNTASAGFNGVGPDGKVQEALLKAEPSSADTAKALQLSVYSVSDADVQAFAKEGKLNAPAKSAASKTGGQ